MSQGWTILVPLKPLDAAKSRLRGATPSLSHQELVLALARATVAAASASEAVGRIVVVGSDALAGVEHMPDRHGDLNAALQEAALLVSGPVAAMPADLPALRPDELTEALRLIDERGFVPDAEGTGTVLLASARGPLRPQFGPGSALAHERSGARRLDGDWPTLRRDVDTPADLDEALRLGWNLSRV
ncbi:2-phospho-L-lactate guanylyltransferase [Allorhizocola rhizosphaerae]|uniref:2-phospho-L-lactate guanylyltransferase n=1 Tax=Allorhizocola rhizosphaerae TaxID=1872709 RepID=UPI000E3E4010|nr:2-phospho-L-lactate guanylyltransferase [Allorhizocola rhizosphaerae]